MSHSTRAGTFRGDRLACREGQEPRLASGIVVYQLVSAGIEIDSSLEGRSR